MIFRSRDFFSGEIHDLVGVMHAISSSKRPRSEVSLFLLSELHKLKGVLPDLESFAAKGAPPKEKPSRASPLVRMKLSEGTSFLVSFFMRSCAPS